MDNIIIRLEAKEQVDQTVGDVAVAPSSNQSGMEISSSESMTGTIAATKGSVMSSVARYAVAIALAKKAYDLAKKVYEDIGEYQRTERFRDEKLRLMGGGSFSANKIGERYNILTQTYVGGQSVAYKRR